MSPERKQKLRVVGEPATRGSVTARLFWSVVTIAVMVYVSGLLIARTEGFRAYLQNRLSAQLGMPVQIGSSRATAGLDLVLGKVSARDEAGGRASVSAGEVRLSGTLGNLIKTGRPLASGVRVKDLQVVFVEDDTGRWAPATLRRYSQWFSRLAGLNLKQTDAETEEDTTPSPRARRFRIPVLEDIRLALRGTELEWWDNQGNLVAFVRGADVYSTPLQVPTRAMTHLKITAATVHSVRGRSASDLNVELIHSSKEVFILAMQMGGPEASGAAAGPDAESVRRALGEGL
jgi:uncharacterized protein YhdP